jgi:hypothetical protein
MIISFHTSQSAMQVGNGLRLRYGKTTTARLRMGSDCIGSRRTIVLAPSPGSSSPKNEAKPGETGITTSFLDCRSFNSGNKRCCSWNGSTLVGGEALSRTIEMEESDFERKYFRMCS